MRTKPLLAVVALIVVAIAVAWWFRAPDEPTPVEADALVAPDPGGDVGMAKPVIEPADVPKITASPQGLYDDLDAAFERAGEKPDLTLEPMTPPPLEPPRRAEDDGEADGEADGGGEQP